MAKMNTSEFIADREFRFKLKIERMKQHMSQSELADKSGLSRGTISSIENPDKSVEYMSVLKYLDALGLELSFKSKPEYMKD